MATTLYNVDYGKKVCIHVAGRSPTPRVIWTRLARPLNDRFSMPADQFGQELVISDVRLGDSGHYQCSASNSVGSPVTHVMSLSVECQSQFTSYFQSRCVLSAVEYVRGRT